jgi:hypothetical protein
MQDCLGFFGDANTRGIGVSATADILAIGIVTMPKPIIRCRTAFPHFPPKGAGWTELWTKFEVLRLAVAARVYDVSGLVIEEHSAGFLKWVKGGGRALR